MKNSTAYNKLQKMYWNSRTHERHALKDHEYASAKVHKLDNGALILQSYSTLIVGVDKDGWIYCTGLYSKTTIKHIGWFCREYLKPLSYYDIKAIADGESRINLYTGEIVLAA